MTTRPNIFPALRYRHAPAAIDWLVAAFGFTKQAVFANPDGSIAHAQLQLGPAVIGLSSAIDTPGSPWSQVRQGIYIRVVEDVDAHHARAVAAGAGIASPLKNTDYGSREYSARDPEGNLWGFGTYDMDAPEGEAAVYPEVHYRNGAAAVSFLEKAFGFSKTFEVPGGNATIEHAEMKYGNGWVMLGSGEAAAQILGDARQCTNVYVADPDAHFARATAAGASIISPLRDQPWARSYAARDPEGFIWGFSNYRPKG